MYSEKKKRLEGAKQRLTNPPKKKKRRKPVKVITSTVENEDESDEDKVYVLKSIADDLCQPQVRRKDGKPYMLCSSINVFSSHGTKIQSA